MPSAATAEQHEDMRMRTTMFVTARTLAVFVAAGVVACASPNPTILAAKDCKGSGLCEVDVLENGCSPMAAHDPILIDKRGGARQVHWIAPAGFVFTADGIKFSASPVIDPRPGIQQGGRRWMVVVRPNGEDVRSKYRIQLKATSLLGTICTGEDPFIVNE
jgi:hypothetical protein